MGTGRYCACGKGIWERFVLESMSWFRMEALSMAAETGYFLTGLYPESTADVGDADWADESLAKDPWGREYRIVTREQKVMVTGLDRSGQPVPLLLLSRSVAWEGEADLYSEITGPGVILLD